jgi:capsid protein
MAATFFRSRSSVIQEVVRRVYEWVMRTSLGQPELRGAPADFYEVSIQAPRSVNVDVGRNSAAMLAELTAGATNYELIYAPQGLDWREETKKLAEQLEYMRGLGLTLPAGAASRNGGTQ